MKRYVLIIFLFIYFSSRILSYSQKNYIYIKIYDDGVALVSYVIHPINNTFSSINVSLIGIPETEIIVVDENNIPLPFQLNKTILTIFYTTAFKINIKYFTQTLTSKIKGVWYLNFTTNLNTTIEFPSKSIIIDLSTIPIVINFSENCPVLTFPPGKHYIKYIIPIIVTNTTTSTLNASKKNYDENRENLSLDKNNENDLIQYIVYIIIPILIILTIILFVLKYRKRKSVLIELREEELQVLNIIKELGGECYQYEIGRRIFLPKTTLWRIIRRLESMGYIEVIKIRGQNYIKIKNL